MKLHQTALVIARGAQIRNSLEVLLHSIDGIEEVYKAAGLNDLSDQCGAEKPAVVMYALEDYPDAINDLEELKGALPASRIIVLVEEEFQCGQVELLGVLCLPNGLLAARLVEIIEDLVMAF